MLTPPKMSPLFQEKLFAQKENKLLSFGEWMDAALYDLDFGYYAKPSIKFGKEGDFITAPTMSPFFAYTLAESMAPLFLKYNIHTLVEFGPGNGKLLFDLLAALEQKDALPSTVYCIEKSNYLSTIQQECLMPWQNKVNFIWQETLSQPLSACIAIANEVLDAIPCERFFIAQGQVYQNFIHCKNESLAHRLLEAKIEHLKVLDKCNIDALLPGPYYSEFHPYVSDFLESISQLTENGWFYWIDYGYSQDSYYTLARKTGTFLAYYKHQLIDDFLPYSGNIDLTASVNFSLISEILTDCNHQIISFEHLASFLLANGILDLAQNHNLPFSELDKKTLPILLMPQEMGEAMKVMVSQKGFT